MSGLCSVRATLRDSDKLQVSLLLQAVFQVSTLTGSLSVYQENFIVTC